MKDQFRNFAELSNSGSRKSYDIKTQIKKSDFLLFAPHGGGIEPGTTEICNWFHDKPYSIYTFSGKGLNCKRLHITSTNFDEPILFQLLTKHDNAISFHGMTNYLSKQINADIYVGGLNYSLIKITTQELSKMGFSVLSNLDYSHGGLSGREKGNVSNKCRQKMGVQIEISEKLRRKFFTGDLKLKVGRKTSTGQLETFCGTIVNAINLYKKNGL